MAKYTTAVSGSIEKLKKHISHNGTAPGATSSGGSHALFLKINHLSEDNFLNDYVRVIEAYR